MTVDAVKIRFVMADVSILVDGYDSKRFTEPIKSGIGILKRGTLMAQNSSDKLWYPYDPNGSNGLNTPRGILLSDVDTSKVTEGVLVEDGKVYGNQLIVGAVTDFDDPGTAATRADTDLMKPLIQTVWV